MKNDVNKTQAVVISLEVEGKREYVFHKTALGASPMVHSVTLDKATLFRRPSHIESVMKDFPLVNPSIDPIPAATTITDVITDDTAKYELFAELSKKMEE